MTPDFSTPDPAEHLNALLGQAGVGSLRALIDLPLAEACNTPGLLSFDAQDWDLVARAAEQSGLIDRLAFGWRDEEPGAGLKEVAPSKRALLCLVGLGIISLAQLYDSRLGTLLSLRRHLGADDIPCLLLRLKEYQISGHTAGLPNNSDTDLPPVSQSISQPDSQIHLDDATARLSIAVLNLSSRTREYLHYSDVHTLRDLVDRIPSDAVKFHSQGVHQLWKEVKASLQTYLDSNSRGSVQAKEPPPEPNLGRERKVTPPDLTKSIPDVATSPELPLDDARPIDVLNLPDYACEQLDRAGIHTISDLIATLPKGPHTIGLITWRHIQSALRIYLANQPAGAPPAAYAEVARNVPPCVNPVPSLHTERPINILDLPDYARDQLGRAGIHTVRDLMATLPLGPRTIGPRTWKRIQCAYHNYLAMQPNDAPFQGPAHPMGEELADAQQVRRSQAATGYLGPLPEVMEDRSITELSLSTDALKCLQRAGFETVGDLWAILAQGYSRLAIPDMSWLLWKEIWLVTTRHVASGIIDSTPLDVRFAAWFAHLNESQRQVLAWRYGLTEGQDLTLEETGAQLNLTRERVRQIEHKALELLQHPSGQGPVHALIAELYADVVAGGGVMSETQLGIALAGIADIGDANPQGAVRLLLETCGKLIKIEGAQAWCLPQLCDLVPLVGLQVIDILKKASAPLSLDELVQRCKQVQGRHDQSDQLYDKFILACVRVNEKLVERHDGSIGLATWERHWQDDIILALRRRGEPAHYTAIADTINASLQNGQHVAARVVHTCLMRYPDIFVCVGVRGTYGLREWNEEQGNSAYMDVLTQILQEAGHSLEYNRDSARSGRSASPSR